MIEINNVKDISVIYDLATRYNLNMSDNDIICALKEDDVILIFALYNYDDEFLNIKLLSETNCDYSYIDGLFKTLVFYADLKRVRYLKIADDYRDFAEKFNFTYKNGFWVFDIYNSDNLHCKCEKDV